MRWKHPIALGLFISVIAFESCNQEKNNAEALAKKHCGSCHLFPEPGELDKITWKQKVLPVMGKLMGVSELGQHPFEESDRIISHEQSTLAAEDWQKIVSYYISNAPTSLPAQGRAPIEKFTSLFHVERPQGDSSLPSNTLLKIDPANEWVYAAGMDSSLQIFDSRLNLVQKITLNGIVVDMFFHNTTTTGHRGGVLTDIGIMHPNDLRTGGVLLFDIPRDAKIKTREIIDTLPRPVQTIAHDLDKDGRVDYLVCGFGNNEGSLFWMRNIGDGRLEHKMLRALPGAVKAYVEDINHDSLPDIIALFAQGREGIYLFVNKGNGEFETRELIMFSPVFGSTFFEMVDLNKDGRKDIVYTCGDNADYSNVLKNYHGVYVYLNEGSFHFKKRFFFPVHGAFKALARDFDKDGDLDIATISYFPDAKIQPKESFVFLEQTSAFEFTPYTIEAFDQGRWLTMDAGDVDQDGDEDIVIGSLYLPQETKQSKTDITERPSFLLLRNNSVK